MLDYDILETLKYPINLNDHGLDSFFFVVIGYEEDDFSLALLLKDGQWIVQIGMYKSYTYLKERFAGSTKREFGDDLVKLERKLDTLEQASLQSFIDKYNPCEYPFKWQWFTADESVLEFLFQSEAKVNKMVLTPPDTYLNPFALEFITLIFEISEKTTDDPVLLHYFANMKKTVLPSK
jgi:hypothetical protein